ncbi:helix-turn-helix domain-containing protein [Saccharothrix texasensis]|uniref:helix-turn-helix domain-containing protein n=1 Tax=Saccharothrix texasensis TaxID=103734 RepID=UPI00147780F4|nr:helix-turn-helix transcriptional regulator [Saccharothrix texasensis]
MRELGDFMARKRATVRPEQVGLRLTPGAKRRTPGLRREEVAQLAGVGFSWYTWIEQGRAENASAAVLDRLAHVLRMTLNERLYIRRLAGLDSKVAEPESTIPVHLLRPYAEYWSAGPAYVIDHVWNVLVVNASARAVLGLRPGVNLVRAMFEDETVATAFTDVRQAQENLVARFRTHTSYYPCDERVRALVRQVSEAIPRFRALWRQHDIAEDSCGDVSVETEDGPTPMHWTTLRFAERSGMKLVTYHPLHPPVTDAGGPPPRLDPLRRP